MIRFLEILDLFVGQLDLQCPWNLERTLSEREATWSYKTPTDNILEVLQTRGAYDRRRHPFLGEHPCN